MLLHSHKVLCRSVAYVVEAENKLRVITCNAGFYIFFTGLYIAYQWNAGNFYNRFTIFHASPAVVILSVYLNPFNLVSVCWV